MKPWYHPIARKYRKSYLAFPISECWFPYTTLLKISRFVTNTTNVCMSPQYYEKVSITRQYRYILTQFVPFAVFVYPSA